MNINKVISGEVKVLSLVKEPGNGSYICSELSCDIEDNKITAVVLESNSKIYRNGSDGGGERYIYFNEEMVTDLAHGFISNTNNNNLSINHEKDINADMKLLESYVQEGKWEVRIELSDGLMSEVRSGEFKGISIESLHREEVMLEITEDLEKFKADAMALNEKTKYEIFGQYNN